MTDGEDYYQILGVDPAASVKEIRAAWRRKALDLHPDRLSQASEKVRHSSQEELKRVNRAYETLSDDEERRKYDADWLRSNSPPKPVVEPTVMVFSDAEPGVRQTGSFVIRNEGGAYKSIWFSDPDSWVKVTGYASLEPDDELPLQVEITALGRDWGRHYTESIAVRLDGVEAAVRVQLNTKPAPASYHTRSATTPTRPAGFPAWAGWAIGAAALGFIIMAAVSNVAEQPDSRAINSRSPVTQTWYQGATGSNYFGDPTPRLLETGYQQRVPGFEQTSPFGPSSPYQQTSPGIRQPSHGVQPPITSGRGVSPGVQPRSPGIQNNRSFGYQPRSSGVQNNRSFGYQPTSAGTQRRR